MNSSKDNVKVINKLDITPGNIRGNVTLLKVPIRVSPKSNEASSRLELSPTNAVLSTAIENGMQINTWPNTTVHRDNSQPNLINITRSETAMIISGKTSGDKIKPIIPFLNGNPYLAPARAAKAPKKVLITEVKTATRRVLRTAPCKASVSQRSINH
jgi:hypothetical protein